MPQHLGQIERLWLAGEIARLLDVARSERHESKWAEHLIRNAYLWYWTADGINDDGKVQRDLFKVAPSYLRHTPEALTAATEGGHLRHEHAVPRIVLFNHLKSQEWGSPEAIVAFLNRFCFGVIVEKSQERSLNEWKRSMPEGWTFSNGADPMARYEKANLKVLEPKHQRLI